MLAMTTQNRNLGAMHLVTQRRPGVHRDYVTHLLRRSFREDGKVKKETIANLTHVPERILEGLRSLLAGKELVDVDSLVVERSTPHGHAEALLSMMHRLKIAPVLDKEPSVQRDLVLAMIAQRILTPGSKLFTHAYSSNRHWLRNSISDHPMLTICTAHSIGSLSGKRPLSKHSRSGICKAAEWRSTICRHRILKAENVRWPCGGTRGMNVADRYKSSTDCYATVTGGQ